MSNRHENYDISLISKEEIIKIGLKGQIYVITNIKKTHNNQYTGQTRTHYRLCDGWINAGYMHRFNSHINEALRGEGDTKLNRAIRKYGREAFKVDLVEECDCSLEILDQREVYYIAKFDTFNNGYNTTPGGRTRAITDEIKKKISKTLIEASESKRLGILKRSQIISAHVYLINRKGGGLICDIHIGNSEAIGQQELLRFTYNTEHDGEKTCFDRILFMLKSVTPSETVFIAPDLRKYSVDYITFMQNMPPMPEYVPLPRKKAQPKQEKLIDRHKDVTIRDENVVETMKGLNITRIHIHGYKLGKYQYVQLLIHGPEKPYKPYFGGKSTEGVVKRALDVITKACPNVKVTTRKDLAHLVPGCQIAGN